MVKISDLIAERILHMLEISEQNTAEIQRNEFAARMGCAPSQINYVLSSRFTPEHGYVIESQRGGGGYIRIRRVVRTQSSPYMHIINSIGDRIDNISAKILIDNCLATELISVEEARLMHAAISRNVISAASTNYIGQEKLRAVILKELFLTLA